MGRGGGRLPKPQKKKCSINVVFVVMLPRLCAFLVLFGWGFPHICFWLERAGLDSLPEPADWWRCGGGAVEFCVGRGGPRGLRIWSD